MAEASSSSPAKPEKIALDLGHFHKYESIRIEWTKHFENNCFDEAHIVKGFFKTFHRTHKGFQFVVAELFDGTTHLVVRADDYQGIKEELERRTKKNLPKVSHVSGVKIKEERKSFPDFESHREFSMSLKSENDKIRQRRREEAKKHLNMLRDSLKSKPYPRVMAFDVETYEYDKVTVLEVGYVIAKIDKPEEQETFHYIIEENLHFSNKDFVPDNRERFKFGTSKRVSLVEAAEKFQKHIADIDFLVTHAGHNDEQYLAGCGISLTGKQIFDTQMLAMALLTGGPQTYSLKRLLGDLAIEYDENVLHNAGNDAVYTLKAFLGLCKRFNLQTSPA